jgi:hypothetical protein
LDTFIGGNEARRNLGFGASTAAHLDFNAKTLLAV